MRCQTQRIFYDMGEKKVLHECEEFLQLDFILYEESYLENLTEK